MALSNGHTEVQERSISPTQHLGKRKRTASPGFDVDTKAKAGVVQQTLKDALEIVKRHDPSAMILRFPLPTRGSDGRTIKKQKIDKTDQETDNIEYRILNAVYQSMNDLMDDIAAVKSILFDEARSTNGTTHIHSTAKERISVIWETLSTLQSTATGIQRSASPNTNGDSAEKHSAPALPSSQVLSLRSQTEYGIRQLFSGLPQSTDSATIAGRNLPNGFELTEVLTVDKNNLQGKDIRKFGDIFAVHRNIKTLEMPRASRSLRGNSIGFIPAFENVATLARNDFRFANLSTGLWLRYAVPEKLNPEVKDKSQASSAKAGALFKSAFSTFAPSIDNSHSIVTDRDRSQQWWKKYGRHTGQKAGFWHSDLPGASTSVEGVDSFSDQELEEMVANYVPEEDEDTETKEVLTEISELIETLCSYQAMRHLEIARGPSSASKPTKDEQSTYEMLRDQLQLLVGALPPFAVAKLNGDQLEELNISTQILVSPPEFVGTAQVDDYTLRHSRTTHATTSASVRNPASIPNRATYGTPASAYNAQARAYNNVPTSAYAARPNVTLYNTPRPATTTQAGAYTQPQYRTGGPAIHTPSIQQFQRPVMNGYGSAATPTPQTSYMQRPSQPGYQQRAQDSTIYNRADPLQKPVTNGDTSHYQQRPYVPANNMHPNSTPIPPGQQRATNDAMKQRQASGTPQLPTGAIAGVGATSP